MTDYLDRLWRKLLAAGRRYWRASGATPRSGRSLRRQRLLKALPVFMSLGVTIAVVAGIATAGVIHGTSNSASSRGRQGNRTVPTGVGQPVVSTAPACRYTRSGLPPLVTSDRNPDSQLSSMLTLARQPANGDGLAALGRYDRAPVQVLTVFRRFVHIVNGERGTRLAIFPAVVCNQTAVGPAQSFPGRIRVAPVQAVVMVVLSNPPPRVAILVGTASTIRHGAALPGLDLPNSRGWIQATVVPDGVARVVMRFTPPFLHYYTATATIHDNVGIVVRKPDYTPTIVSWYAADGHLIHTFIDRQQLRYEQCLRAHRKNC